MEKSPFAKKVWKLQVVGGCSHIQGVHMGPVSLTSHTARSAMALPIPRAAARDRAVSSMEHTLCLNTTAGLAWIKDWEGSISCPFHHES